MAKPIPKVSVGTELQDKAPRVEAVIGQDLTKLATDSGAGGPPLIIVRKNPILEDREGQLDINMLSQWGGIPYIASRLSRFAGETKICWEGGSRQDGATVTGRKAQAHCVPYPGRITDKINQYVFATSPKRDHALPVFLEDASQDGLTIDQFMREVNSLVTSCGWCWIGVDLPNTNGQEVSLLTKEAQKIRPYFVLYSATDVVDWRFDRSGNLLWVLTEGEQLEGDDPFQESSTVTVRNLWQPGMRTQYKIVEDKIVDETVFPFGFNLVPFVLVGKISAKPHLFDSIESINRTILDLESVSRQNYFDCCFPQVYMPASALQSAQHNLEVSGTEAVNMILGLHYPILLGPNDPTPGYMTPPATDLESVGKEIGRLKEAMFDCVGMMLRKGSKVAESGEAKAWDHLDITAVLADRANLLEQAEQRAVKIANAWDSGFTLYTPQYNKDFNAADFATEMQALIMAGQVSQPPELSRVILRKVFEVIRRIGYNNLSPEEVKVVEQAIKTYDVMSEPVASPAEALPGKEKEEGEVPEEEEEPPVK